MKILVAAKRVVDPSMRIRVKPDGSGVDIADLRMSINPFDEIALEQAIQMKEAGQADQILVVSIGPPSARDTLRTALAMGADRAILILTDTAVEPLAVAKILRRVALDEHIELILMGKQAIDDDCNQTGQMLAALLDWPQGTFASAVVLGGNALTVTREIDTGLQTIRMPLPAVVTTDLRLNQPRYPSLASIMQARRKPIEEHAIADLGIDVAPRLKLMSTAAPVARKGGVLLSGVDELLDRLRNETRVI